MVTTPPEGRKIQQLYTTKEFGEDFILRLEFRATPNADSGVYIRGPQLQCRDYLLAGPYKDLKLYKPQDWNELEVTVHGGVARATANGELLEAEMKVPPSGPIGLEGDRGQMEYRRIRIKVSRSRKSWRLVGWQCRSEFAHRYPLPAAVRQGRQRVRWNGTFVTTVFGRNSSVPFRISARWL